MTDSTLHFTEFPFEEIRRQDGNYFDTWSEAKLAGYSDDQIWSVCEEDGVTIYGPPHHYVNRLGYLATAEKHDGKTYYQPPIYTITGDRRRWDHSGQKPIKITCSTCGSDDVRRDAWAEWDIDLQKWVLGTVFDAGHCESCEGESRLVEEELEESLFTLVPPPTN